MSALVELELETYAAQRFPEIALAAAYDLQCALAMAWVSQLAYESDSAKIDAVLQAWSMRRAAMVGDPSQQDLTAPAAWFSITRARGSWPSPGPIRWSAGPC